MTTPVLEMDNVCFSWSSVKGSIHAVQDVSLKMQATDYLGMVGPNGGGKSTLLKLALGLLQPQHGQIKLLGDTPKRTRHRVGFVPQLAQLNTTLPCTVKDVVMSGRLSRSFWGAWFGNTHKQQAIAALERVGMAEMANRPLEALSGGQRQRVLLARALASRPELLILDEPATGIDPDNYHRLILLLRSLHQEGLPLLVVSHDTQFVAEEVTHVGCMNRELHIHAADALTDDILEQASHVRMRQLHHEDDCPIQHPPATSCTHD